MPKLTMLALIARDIGVKISDVCKHLERPPNYYHMLERWHDSGSVRAQLTNDCISYAIYLNKKSIMDLHKNNIELRKKRLA
jgi:hypothetical protein